MTGLRARFAKNLRRLSSGAESYAAVARAVGINRQQFNDYLTGNNLPNETIIKKLCKHFDVDLSEFFVPDADSKPKGQSANVELELARQVQQFVDAHRSSSEFLPKSGIYKLYFLPPFDFDIVVCSILVVKNHDGICQFRRITRLAGGSFYNSIRKFSVHKGIATYSKDSVVFTGVNNLDQYAPSFMICNPVVSKDVLYTGFAFVNAPTSYEIAPFVVLNPKKELTLREAFKSVRIHRTDSPELDRAALNLLFRTRNSQIPKTQ